MSDKKNMDLNQFSNRELPPLKKKAASSTAPQLVEDYQGMEDVKGRSTRRFRVISNDGKSYGCAYAHLVDWEYDRANSYLILTIGGKVFTLEGKNLGKIETYLMDEKVKALRQFNPKAHKAPAQNEILIERIEVEVA